MKIKIEFQKYSFFGITFYRKVSPSGEILKLARKETRSRAQSDDIFITTKGKYIVLDENQNPGNFIERTPGVFSSDLNPYIRGIYHLKAEQDSEWWCVKKQDLLKSGYTVEKFYLAKDNTSILTENSKYVFFTGSFKIIDTIPIIKAPLPVETTSQKEIVGLEELVGFKFVKL